ncbi:MAG TPA: hypothetical protein VEB63_12275 [Chitinophagaceae bacterium]|nr:hypothetical protein [Chitinophagaceae bacterium]
MVTTQKHINWLSALALLLLLPATYVIVIAVLKYGLGISAPFEASAPVLERWGIKEPVGWNINLAILFGPILALALAATQLLRIRIQTSNERFHFDISILRRTFPLTVVFSSILVMGVLFLYMVGENCRPCE